MKHIQKKCKKWIDWGFHGNSWTIVFIGVAIIGKNNSVAFTQSVCVTWTQCPSFGPTFNQQHKDGNYPEFFTVGLQVWPQHPATGRPTTNFSCVWRNFEKASSFLLEKRECLTFQKDDTCFPFLSIFALILSRVFRFANITPARRRNSISFWTCFDWSCTWCISGRQTRASVSLFVFPVRFIYRVMLRHPSLC